MPQEHLPISAEARGLYRTWRTQLERRAASIEAVCCSPPFSLAVSDFIHCTRAGREKAFNQLRRLLEGAGARFVDRTEPRRARRAYLRSTGMGWIQAVIAAASRHDMGWHTWFISWSDHSLQRTLQRSPPGLHKRSMLGCGRNLSRAQPEISDVTDG